MSAIVGELGAHLLANFQADGVGSPDAMDVRRELLRRISALGPAIDTALGEASHLHERQHMLTAAVNGMFAAASAWRTIAGHLRRLPDAEAGEQVARVLAAVPAETVALLSGDIPAWRSYPAGARDRCAEAARTLDGMATADPSTRLLADRLAMGLLGLSHAANGLALIVNPVLARGVPRQPVLTGATDLLPALVNGLRAFATLIVVELLWILTDWQGGQGAVTFAFVTVVLLAPRGEQAAHIAFNFAIGTLLTAGLAAVAEFALLPQQHTFTGLAAVMALFLVPLTALSTVARFSSTMVAAVMNFTPLLGPTNVISYNPGTFYNSILAIVAGVGATVIAFHLMPPVPPAMRAERLLGLTLAELRGLATRSRLSYRQAGARQAWEDRVYRRLAAMPEQAELIELARLVTALAVGSEIILLRQTAGPDGSAGALGASLRHLAAGRITAAVAELARLDAALAASADGTRAELQVRAGALALSEALGAHAGYFTEGARVP
jgi:uncharacterized membrane protein YccC